MPELQPTAKDLPSPTDLVCHGLREVGMYGAGIQWHLGVGFPWSVLPEVPAAGLGAVLVVEPATQPVDTAVRVPLESVVAEPAERAMVALVETVTGMPVPVKTDRRTGARNNCAVL